MTTRHPRIACIIVGCCCGSTRHAPGLEIICAKHYRLVSPALKALRRRARRRGNARLDQMLWRRVVQQAQERAAGL